MTKQISDFYPLARMKDGVFNKCKECYKKDVRENRLSKIEYYREYDSRRAKLPDRIKLATMQTKAWRNEDARRNRCHSAVSRAIKNGLLVPAPCKLCGELKSVAHHDDYDKPLEVVWLCQSCHVKLHKGLI